MILSYAVERALPKINFRTSIMRLSSVLVALVFAVLSFALWSLSNRPTDVPVWPQWVKGYAFSPFRNGQDALIDNMPSEAQIVEDVRLLSESARELRTYSSRKSLASVPVAAKQFDMDVNLGIWLDTNMENNAEELSSGISLANLHDSVTRVMVGNESILRGDFAVSELGALLDSVREQVEQPVSTAEPWHVWLSHPELVQHVDFITVHLLPYWEGVHVDAGMEYIKLKMSQLKAQFPEKPILIGEVGWPSDGRTRGSAVANTANEALFLRRFLALAQSEGYDYFLMEAFDQPWKAQSEGGVGAYWGVYDVNRRAKFSFNEPIVRVQDWPVLAVISIFVSILLLAFFVFNSVLLKARGHSLIALIASVAGTATVWILYEYSQKYLNFTSIIVGIFLLLAVLSVMVLLLTEAHEWAEAHWFRDRRRCQGPVPLKLSDDAPKVSIHVPSYNEPPAMLIETLNALARLDYPNFEVIVVDNNTQDESVWLPVQNHCRSLGPRFQFFHVAPLAGFKAGALNYALEKTSENASIIAAIDSDYQVERNWLRDLLGAFVDPKLAIVQAPQDYRDAADSAFKSMCFSEYRGFFEIGMQTRNERNAIIQHGTMTLVRRSVLEELGGWGEWCITEDAELGLRIFEAGYEASYLPYSYGRGLMPDTFIDYKKQRFRWAFGAMQIMRRHARELFSSQSLSLTRGQRYHFLAGWFPWVADGLCLMFNCLALGWSLAMILAPDSFDPPLIMFSLLPIVLFGFKLTKVIYLYRRRIKASVRQTLAAAVAGLSLSHTVGLAIIKGLLVKDMPFFRTPKCAKRSALGQAFSAVKQELFLFLALLSAATVLFVLPREYGSPDLLVWILALVVQSVPYGAAVFVSIVSSFSWSARLLGKNIERRLFTSGS
ncbi:MAG: glycosyltransferase [Pseudohongiellaceae bacterium]|nr:glycosyltransferase [Pseudohongiellaceae bacterium]